jgi:hypothetical protein
MLKLATVTHTFLSPTTKMRPKRIPKPSATLLNDPNQATLPSQQQSTEKFRIAEAARHAAETKLVIEAEAACALKSRGPAVGRAEPSPS